MRERRRKGGRYTFIDEEEDEEEEEREGRREEEMERVNIEEMNGSKNGEGDGERGEEGENEGEREGSRENVYKTDDLELYTSAKSCLFVLSSVLNWVHAKLKTTLKDKVRVNVHLRLLRIN